MRTRYLILLMIFVSLLGACSHDDENKVFIIVNQTGYTGTVQAGSTVIFTVSASSTETDLSKITVVENTATYGRRELMDSAVTSKQTEFNFKYTVPEILASDTGRVRLAFEATDNNNNKAQMTLLMTVTAGAPLREVSGTVMYSARSGRPDGLMLSDFSTVYVADLTTEDVDIYDYLDSTASDSTLMSLQWRSGTGVEFARFNDFNYPGASLQGLVNAWSTSSHYNIMKEIHAGDIILVGRRETVIGVIQVEEVYDGPSVENDRYILNIKGR